MLLWTVWRRARTIVREFMHDEAFQLAAALSFYALLSLAPLLTVLVGIAGIAFGPEAASGQIVPQIQRFVGHEVAHVAETVIEHTGTPRNSILAVIAGIDVLLFGATAGFVQLQTSLNRIWGAPARRGLGVRKFIRTRLLSLLMVIGIALVLLVSLLASASLSAINTHLTGVVPEFSIAWQVIDVVASLMVTTLLFAAIFKVLPDVEISWSNVWVGAIVTAALFIIGKSLIGLYLGHSGVGSVYGAAGSVVVFIVWIYYSAAILFLGAEFTKVYSRRSDARLQPGWDAEPGAPGGRLAPG